MDAPDQHPRAPRPARSITHVFLQLVLGRVADGEGLRRQWERRMLELGPGARGWPRSTGGVTDDGRVVLITWFASQEAAAASSQHPDHVAWWSAIQACLAEPVTVLETDDIGVLQPHDPLGAGFVQVMRTTVRNREEFERSEADLGPEFIAWRPDFLAGYRAWFPDGTLAAVDYFRSEAEARAGESKEMPAALHVGFQEWMSMMDGAEWYDITEPWPSPVADA